MTRPGTNESPSSGNQWFTETPILQNAGRGILVDFEAPVCRGRDHQRVLGRFVPDTWVNPARLVKRLLSDDVLGELSADSGS